MPLKPRILSSEFPIHITARTNGRRPFNVHPDTAWEVFSDYLFLIHLLFDIRIHAFVMMPNHLHILVRDPKLNLSTAMEMFMRETSKEFGRISQKPGRLWGSRFYSSVISDPSYYLNAYKYIYRNPVRAGLCRSPFEYRYSTLTALIGRQATVLRLEDDDTLFSSFESSVHWLERKPLENIESAIRIGLRRAEFAPARNESTKKPTELESFNLIPER